MTQQIIHDLSNRYTCKKYDATKRISADDIAVIKQALRMSPSSVNSQPWKFIILESNAAKQRFHDSFVNKHQFNQQHAKEASHIILFAYHPRYSATEYKKVVAAEVASGHLPADKQDEMMTKGMFFAGLNTDEQGVNGHWTKAQTYLALGNTLHTLARLGIDSTPMEGVDAEMIGEIFKAELGDYVCDFALAMGYHHASEDFNHGKPKARLPLADVVTVL